MSRNCLESCELCLDLLTENSSVQQPKGTQLRFQSAIVAHRPSWGVLISIFTRRSFPFSKRYRISYAKLRRSFTPPPRMRTDEFLKLRCARKFTSCRFRLYQAKDGRTTTTSFAILKLENETATLAKLKVASRFRVVLFRLVGSRRFGNESKGLRERSKVSFSLGSPRFGFIITTL